MGLGGRVWECSACQSSRGELEHELLLVGHLKARAAQSRGAQLETTVPWPQHSVSEATHGLSNERCLILSINEHPPSGLDPTKCWQLWKPRQLLNEHRSTPANSPTTGILGAHWTECWTQSCQKSMMWDNVTYQQWVSFLVGFLSLPHALTTRRGEWRVSEQASSLPRCWMVLSTSQE